MNKALFFLAIVGISVLAMACLDEANDEPSPTPTRAPVKATATPRPVLPTPTPVRQGNCHPAYPDVCIAPPPPDLDCFEIPFLRFKVLRPDPHRFDRDRNGVGCES